MAEKEKFRGRRPIYIGNKDKQDALDEAAEQEDQMAPPVIWEVDDQGRSQKLPPGDKMGPPVVWEFDERGRSRKLPPASQVQNVEPLQPEGKKPFKLEDYPEYQYAGGKGGGFRSLSERLTGHDLEDTSWGSWNQGPIKPKGKQGSYKQSESKKSPQESAPVDRKYTAEEIAAISKDFDGLTQEMYGQQIVEQAKRNAKEGGAQWPKFTFGNRFDKDIREKAAEDAILKHKWRN